MNRRQKKKLINRWKTGTAKQRKYNKWLCDRYPFLIPRNVWSDKISWSKKYSWTEAEGFPTGWWKAFGLLMCEDLRDELLKYNYLEKFRFTQIKEKYGELRAYHNGIPKGAKDIIPKYTVLSRNICIVCGRPDVPMIGHGWISPECFDCWKKRNKWHLNKTKEELMKIYEDEKTNVEDIGKMHDTYVYHAYKGDEEWIKVEVDISETAGKIREIWRSKHGDI